MCELYETPSIDVSLNTYGVSLLLIIFSAPEYSLFSLLLLWVFMAEQISY